jgi:phage repressor protein C with HTH and peptisase S24 domain
MQTPDQVRETLDRLLKEQRVGYAAISRMISRNSAYIQQFITRGRPTRLDEQDRRRIADFLGVDERLLGAPEREARHGGDVVQVRRLAVEASAGLGAVVDDEMSLGSFGFDRMWLRRLTHAKPEQLSIIRIKGDSMAPTLVDGDETLVDQSRRDPRGGDSIYVLRRDDTLMVKRLTVTPSSGLLTISSDNQAHPTWRDCPPGSLTIIGRTIATLRRLS